MEEDCLEVAEGEEVEVVSWEDWEVQPSLIIPTRIHSEPQQVPALSLEIFSRQHYVPEKLS